jgi:hypothetical protein
MSKTSTPMLPFVQPTRLNPKTPKPQNPFDYE